MDYTTESCQKAFLEMRSKLQKAIKKASINEKEDIAIDEFNNICLKASKDDPIAQDYLAYIFKKGLNGVVEVNYEKFMQWEILAGANGNQFAIDKLALFLNFALNEIMYAEDINFLISRNNLTDENYMYVVGRLVCEALVDELRLDPNALLKEPLVHLEFNSKLMRSFDRARNFTIPKILKFLRN